MPPVVIAAGVAAAGAVAGGAIASSGAKKAAQTSAQGTQQAADAQLQSTREALAAQERQYQRAFELNRGYLTEGDRADAIINASLYGEGSYDPTPSYSSLLTGTGAPATSTPLTPTTPAAAQGGGFFARAAQGIRTALQNGPFDFNNGEAGANNGVSIPSVATQPAPTPNDTTTYTGANVLEMARASPWGQLYRDANARASDDLRGYAANNQNFFSGRNLASQGALNARYDQAAFDDWYKGIQARSAGGRDARNSALTAGANAANNQAQLYSQQGNALANLYQAGGVNAANAQLAGANAWAGAANNAIGALARGYGGYYGSGSGGGGGYNTANWNWGGGSSSSNGPSYVDDRWGLY